MEYKNMESIVSDVSRFVLVDKKQWKKHLKELFNLGDNEVASFKISECPDAPDCYYFTILKRDKIEGELID
jgi:hypothetical protein